MTRSTGILPVLVAVLPMLSCSTAYHARAPRAAGGPGTLAEEIAHCLLSAGLYDRTAEAGNAQRIAEDPELVAIWETPRRSFWSTTPGCAAAVRREPGRWHVVFVGRSGDTSEAAQVLSDAFAHCVELHAPDTSVRVEPERFLDLR